MRKIITVALLVLLAAQARALTYRAAPGTQVTPLPTIAPTPGPRHRHRVASPFSGTPVVGMAALTPTPAASPAPNGGWKLP